MKRASPSYRRSAAAASAPALTAALFSLSPSRPHVRPYWQGGRHPTAPAPHQAEYNDCVAACGLCEIIQCSLLGDLSTSNRTDESVRQ